MAQGSITWLSRLARHEAPFLEEIKSERRRKLFGTREEACLFAAGEEADAEAERLKRELQKAVEEGRRKVEEAQNYAAHLAQKCLFEQARADAWKAACEEWELLALHEPSASGIGAKEAIEKARRSERLQAVATARDIAAEEDDFPTDPSPRHAEARNKNRRSE